MRGHGLEAVRRPYNRGVAGSVHFVLVAIGSAGDVNPFLGLAGELAGRGHRVTLVANAYFVPETLPARVALVPLGSEEEFEAVTRDPDVWRGARGTRKVIEFGLIRPIRPVYDAIAARYVAGETVVVAGSLAVGARVAHDKLGVPLASVHLQPSILRSAFDTPVLPGPPVHRLPRVLKPLAFGVIDRVADLIAGEAINAARAELQLPPVRRWFAHWWHAPQLVLGLWPEWFAPTQPDWPTQVRLAGFPLYDDVGGAAVPAEVEAFLDPDGPGGPPILATPGSANRHARDFFEAAIAACGSLRRRLLVLTRFPEQLPATLPPGVLRAGYVPLSRVLPRCGAILHHGGIGTMSQAFAAGVPQVVMPMAHAQFDNARRAAGLGVARWLPRKRFTAANVTRDLRWLLGSSGVAERCRALAAEARAGGGLGAAADLLEGLHAA